MASPRSTGTFADIIIRADDGDLNRALPAFSITVKPANRAPTISGSPATSITTGQVYRFRPTANDADGDSLGFTVQNKPAWASFSTSTGELSGTPNSAGTFTGIVITASDGKASAALAAFQIKVTVPANRAPTITGVPATAINGGSAYEFPADCRRCRWRYADVFDCEQAIVGYLQHDRTVACPARLRG